MPNFLVPTPHDSSPKALIPISNFQSRVFSTQPLRPWLSPTIPHWEREERDGGRPSESRGGRRCCRRRRPRRHILRAYPAIWAGLLLAVTVGCIYWGSVGVVLDRQGRVPEQGGVPGAGGGRTKRLVAYIRRHGAPQVPNCWALPKQAGEWVIPPG